ncbi:VOC family protein [Devosia alba]|uniref:VOC family protein n=1 Tax=Devosia alba TaxID=3152360 RepID=UPI003266727F
MAKLVHSMIRVIDEARSLDFYRRAFGLQIVDRIEFPEFALIYLNDPTTGGFELELTVNFGRTQPYDLGDGYGHLAVVVDDVDAEHARLIAAGFAPRKLVDFKNGDKLVGRFFFVADPDGYQIEVIQQGGRFG